MRKFPYPNVPEFKVFKKLDKPWKIQDFLDKIPMNFLKRHTYYSPLSVLKKNKSHCMEGAMLASAIFWYHGERPLLLDLKTTDDDEDHVVALFKENGLWGAISKTNHAVLRYRDPVYRSIRELVMSYFNEYFLNNGEKTLRSFSKPFSLLQFDDKWLISEKHQSHIAEALDFSPHTKILDKSMVQKLRPADKIEIEAGTITEWEE